MAARSLAVALAAAILGCATAPAHEARSCGAAFDRADAVLREGLATYVAEMKRYAQARDPGTRTAGAEERARVRADAWTAERRPRVVAACGAWPEERVRCVLAAGSPQDLSACGLGELVSSFTDEVVATFAARPLDPAAAPAP